MEKNLLPIGVANSRPNHDLNTYGSKDTLFSNVYFEVFQDAQTETQKVFCIKRPGISSTITASWPGSDLGLGCFAAQPYNTTNIFFAATGFPATSTYIYHYNGTNTQYVFQAILSNNRVNFTNIGLPDDLYTTAFAVNSSLYLFKDRTRWTVVTPVVGANLTRPVYLNNRIFIGDRNTGQIYQSALGVYTDWTLAASEWLTVESYGGKLVDLARYNNFIVAIKEYSVEFFEDVANPNGVVLGRVGQALQQVGTVHGNTLVDTGAGELIWLANDESSNRSVVRLTNSFQVEPIQDALVAKYLNLIRNHDGSYAYLLNANGHQFYVLTLKSVYNDKNNVGDIANITLVYDLQNKLWTHWYSYGENTSLSSGGFDYVTLGRWNVSSACRTSNNVTLVQDFDTGNLYQLDDAFVNDGAAIIPVTIRIGNIDLGTHKRKFINKLTVMTDAHTTGPAAWSTTQTFYVYLSRSDGSTTTSIRTTTAYPHSLYALGSAREFTLSLVHTTSRPMRVSAINIDYDVGEGHGIS